MVRRCAGLLSTALLIGTGLWAQGLDTQASKDDWEEINFDFNSSVLVDGFPSLLRLAELLQTNAGYKVRVEGHTDGIGFGRVTPTGSARTVSTSGWAWRAPIRCAISW